MRQTFLTEFIDGGPGCMRDDCMVSQGPSSTTLVYNPPVVNADGININRDTNRVQMTKRCLSCGKSWTEEWQSGFRIS